MKKIKERTNEDKKPHSLSAALLILISFASVILIGTICLLLPFATVDGQGLSFIDALFVASSATCVTGLSTIQPGTTLTLYGQIVLAVLIELGGLSFFTLFSFIFVLFGRKLDINTQLLMKEQLNQDSLLDIKKLIKKIVFTALIIQLLGAGLSFLIFYFKYSFTLNDSIKYGLFHAISSFCNAGFDIFTYSEASLIPFKDDIALNSVTILLIILGGLGFAVISEIFTKHNWHRFSLNTKIVLLMSGILFFGGFILFKIFNWNEMSFTQALFNSATARTAGFMSYDMANLSEPNYILMIFLMFIGASPCSTGGGFKTTSFFILIMALVGYIKGRSPRAFYRKISSKQIEKTLALFILEISYLVIVGMLICSFEAISGSGIEAKPIIFETVSAFATVGLSQGITSSLCLMSKILIIITMFLGRLGPLTIVSIWNNRNSMLMEADIKYVEENIIVG